jgi:hypothetical protein
MIKRVYIVFLGAGLLACSQFNAAKITSEYISVTGNGRNKIDTLIFPYRDSLSIEMEEVVAKSAKGMVAQRPGSDLMNWVSDAVFSNQTKIVRLSEPAICLLNTGGIRSSINQGNVTVGDLFKLMPFDNEIVWARMPSSAISDIEEYIKKTGGEPLANAHMDKGKLMIHGWRSDMNSFIVITSDYLLNGGDKATFFEKRLETNFTGKLVRNALIEEARIQKELMIDSVIRISF